MAPPGCFTLVNVPPTTTVLPICTIAFTLPSRTFGVFFAGASETTTSSGVAAERRRRRTERHDDERNAE